MVLIEYLENESSRLQLHQRAALDGKNGDIHANATQEEEDVDAYVGQLVAALRDFPFHRMTAGRTAGAWVRDEVIAPVFHGRWDFYNNTKASGYDFKTMEHMLNGQNMLIAKLRYVQRSANL